MAPASIPLSAAERFLNHCSVVRRTLTAWSRQSALTGAAIAAALAPVSGSAQAEIISAPVLPQPQPTALTTPIDRSEILALSEAFKADLDARVLPVRNPLKRALALHSLLFEPHGYNIQYHSRHTRTAMETLNQGSGNCVALANLYVAAARHVGLKAYFQENITENWQHMEDVGGYYVVAGHVNVLVKATSRKKMTVEFIQAYIGQDAETRIMSDDEAIAQYYNNIGMDQLYVNQVLLAQRFVDEALSHDKRSPQLWSNKGIVEKRLGNFGAAEQAYLKALKFDKDNPSASKNLYVLYTQRGDHKQAQKYSAIVDKHNQRNPYYLDKLATQALEQQEYDKAIKLAKRAIRIKDSEDRFYYSLAKAYYLKGDTKRAAKAMQKAEEVAVDPVEQRRYRSKLDAMAQV